MQLIPFIAAVLTLTWVDNSDNELAFEVERSSDGETFATLATLPEDTTTYADETVETGNQYWYRVRAGNEHGYSGYSNVATAVAVGVPNAPGGFEIEIPPVKLRLIQDPDGSLRLEAAAQ